MTVNREGITQSLVGYQLMLLSLPVCVGRTRGLQMSTSLPEQGWHVLPDNDPSILRRFLDRPTISFLVPGLCRGHTIDYKGMMTKEPRNQATGRQRRQRSVD